MKGFMVPNRTNLVDTDRTTTDAKRVFIRILTDLRIRNCHFTLPDEDSPTQISCQLN